MPLPTAIEPTLFSRAPMVFPSRFLKPIHPKSNIAPERGSIQKVIAAGWWGQPKIHGHRAQIHIPAAGMGQCIVYNRQGKPHREVLPASIETELQRIFAPAKDWNVIDAEWLKSNNTLFVFDFLKRDGEILDSLSFAQRYALLPRLYLSPHISTLPVFKTVDRCVAYLSGDLPPFIEGLVFRAALSPGFADSTIVRCRLQG